MLLCGIIIFYFYYYLQRGFLFIMSRRNISTQNIIIAAVSSLIILFAIVSIFFIANNFHIEIQPSQNTLVKYKSGENFEKPSAAIYGNFLFKNGKQIDVNIKGAIDFTQIGEQTVTYSAKYLFCRSSASQTLTIKDLTPPVIELKHTDGYYTLPNESYIEEGFTAIDDYDGDITDKVERTEKDGIIYYSVTDSFGNTSVVEREIPYNDPTPPIIELLGGTSITISAGNMFIDPGYKAIDNVDGDITGNVVINGSVDTYEPGEYTLTYQVSDNYDNSAQTTRTVIVEKSSALNTVTPDEKVIYLTFDDGPGPYTERLLNILDKYNVKVTFFVVNGKYNHLLAKEAAAGHSIGVHSATHKYEQIYSGTDAFFEDFNKMRQIIYDNTGIKTNLLRFPGGSSNAVSKQYTIGIMSELTKTVTDCGLKYFDWNVSSGDAGGTTSTAEVVSNVINGVKNKKTAVVLQHDIKEFSVDAVEQIIIWGLNNGYKFLPLDESSPAMHHNVNN